MHVCTVPVNTRGTTNPPAKQLAGPGPANECSFTRAALPARGEVGGLGWAEGGSGIARARARSTREPHGSRRRVTHPDRQFDEPHGLALDILVVQRCPLAVLPKPDGLHIWCRHAVISRCCVYQPRRVRSAAARPRPGHRQGRPRGGLGPRLPDEAPGQGPPKAARSRQYNFTTPALAVEQRFPRLYFKFAAVRLVPTDTTRRPAMPWGWEEVAGDVVPLGARGQS